MATLLFALTLSTLHAQAAEPLKAPSLVQKLAALPTGDFDTKLSAYLKKQMEWAKLHESDGDSLLAKGDVKAAFDSYQLAMGEIGTGGYWHGWKIQAAPGGFQVIEVKPGSSVATAGAEVGDLLISMDGIKLEGYESATLDVWFYAMDAVPTRPQVFSVKRGGGQDHGVESRSPTYPQGSLK